MTDIGNPAISAGEEVVTSGAEETLQALLGSCRATGATFSPKITFKVTGDAGVGVFAKELVTRGEVLMSVPYELCISAQKVCDFPALSPIFQDNPGLLNYPDEVLAIGLMYAMRCVEQNKLDACSWAMHVKTMPTVFNTPLYWTEPELERLKGHNIYHLTLMLKRQMLNDFQSIHAPIVANYPEIFHVSADEEAPITFEHYVWALSIVYSRALELERKGEIERCIVPVLDMVNHHPYLGINPLSEGSSSESDNTVFHLASALSATAARDTFHFSEAEDAMLLLAGRDYGRRFAPRSAADAEDDVDEQLEEIYAVYGNYSNAKLLYSYGFVLPQGLNPFGGVDVYTKLLPSATFFDRKERIIAAVPALAAMGRHYDFVGTVQKGGLVSEDLIAYVRVLQAQDVELTELEQRIRLANATSTPRATARIATALLSKTNEVLTLQALQELLLVRARVAVAQDEKTRLGELLLSDEFVSSDREFLALTVQCEDREILLEAVEKLRERQAALDKQ